MSTPDCKQADQVNLLQRSDLAPADYCDPVIETYKKDVDRTLLRENLRLTVEQRIQKAINFHEMVDELRKAGERHRAIQREKQPT